MATMRQYRARQTRARTSNSISQEGAKGLLIGEHPLTLWIIASVIVIYLYVRRTKSLNPTANPTVKTLPPKPKISIPSGPPVLPPGYGGKSYFPNSGGLSGTERG